MGKRPPKPEGVEAQPRYKDKGKSSGKRKFARMGKRGTDLFVNAWGTIDDDRAIAIVGAAFLENTLATALESRFRKLTVSEHKTIFDQDRAVLGTFSDKINLGYVLGL